MNWIINFLWISNMSLLTFNGFLNPDIIIADNRLPGDAFGVDVVRTVQKELKSKIPSVIVTGDVERSHVQSITAQGFPVLLKPIQPAKFRAIISHLVRS